ncbi:MAG: hypothetical protein WEC81_01915 [Patescibacteria group bacterium]
MVERGDLLPNGSEQFEAPRVDGGELSTTFSHTEKTVEQAPEHNTPHPDQAQSAPAEQPKHYDLSAVVSGTENPPAVELQAQLASQMETSAQEHETQNDAA